MQSNIKACLSCYRENVELKDIPAITKQFLAKHSLVEPDLNQVCQHCMDEFEGFKKNPDSYLSNKKQELLEKRNRWLVRVDTLKNAYQTFRNKEYAEAKVKYLEYIKTIELCLGIPLKEINSVMFTKNGRPDELNPFTLALWDLIIICDQEKDPDLSIYATKFIELARFSLARKTIIHSIKKYKRQSNDKKVFNQMLLDLGSNSGCFIASYAYENAYSPEVMRLRQFRDETLALTPVGRLFIKTYYLISPLILPVLPDSPRLKQWLRWALSRL